MTKLIAIMLSTCVVCFLPGCMGDEAADPTPAAPAATGAQATPAVEAATTTQPPAAGTLTPWLPPATEAAPTDLCSLDAINGNRAINAVFNAAVGQGSTFEGWASTVDTRDPGNIAIVLDGATDFQVTGSTGVARSDVASAFGAGLANAGFKIELAELNLPPGQYAVHIRSVNTPVSFVCNTKTTLIIG